MKKIIFACIVLVSPLIMTAQTVVQNSKKENFNTTAPIFHWNETTFDFGKIKLNVPVTHEFYFTNTGRAPLIISSVKASCGCTVAEYSKEPIAPGQRGFVKATYNAAKSGVFNKTITVNVNTEDMPVQLYIKGEVGS